MRQGFIAYLGAIVTFLIIDAIWLGFIATDFFQNRIGHLMADQINLPAVVLFYLLYGVGIVYFAVVPAIQSANIRTAILNGFLFGFLAYGTYDVTNYATLRDYPFSVVVVDIMWGAVLTAVSATIGYLAAQRFASKNE